MIMWGSLTMNKYGQMGTPLSLLLAIVIGGVVFVFLVGFAYKFIALSGSLSAAETVVALSDEFAAFSVAESAEKAIDYGVEFDFVSYEGKISTEGQTKEVSEIIFSPLELKADELYVATKSVELPYRIGNVFYLSDQNTVYVLVYDDDSEEAVSELEDSYNSLPRNFPSYTFDIDEVSSNVEGLYELTASYDNVRFVFFTSYSEVINEIAETFSNYDVLQVSSSEDLYEFGIVEFADGSEHIYLGYPLLVGAIVSFDASSYSYNLDRVLDRLSSVTTVYYDKSKFVSARLPSCDYSALKSALNNYRSFVGDTESYASYVSKIENVDETNDALGGDCPEIF